MTEYIITLPNGKKEICRRDGEFFTWKPDGCAVFSRPMTLKKLLGIMRNLDGDDKFNTAADDAVGLIKLFPRLDIFRQNIIRHIKPRLLALLIEAARCGDTETANEILDFFGLSGEKINKNTIADMSDVVCREYRNGKWGFIATIKGKTREIFNSSNECFVTDTLGQATLIGDGAHKKLNKAREHFISGFNAAKNGDDGFDKRTFIDDDGQDSNLYFKFVVDSDSEIIVDYFISDIGEKNISRGKKPFYEMNQGSRISPETAKLLSQLLPDVDTTQFDEMFDISAKMLIYAIEKCDKYTALSLKYKCGFATEDEANELTAADGKRRFVVKYDLYDRDKVKLLAITEKRRWRSMFSLPRVFFFIDTEIDGKPYKTEWSVKGNRWDTAVLSDGLIDKRKVEHEFVVLLPNERLCCNISDDLLDVFVAAANEYLKKEQVENDT